ncbi:hypothetical protein V5785_22830, partial [Bacillus subtilis]
ITKNGVKNPPAIVELPVGFPSSIPYMDLKREKLDDDFFETVRIERIISRESQRKYSITQIPVRLDDMKVSDGELSSPCRVFSGWANAKKLAEFIDNGCMPIPDGEDQIRFYLNKNGCIRYRKTRESARNILS